MKTLVTKRVALALTLTGAVLPLTIVGCGGGNDGPSKPKPTATPTTNPTTAPTTTPTTTPGTASITTNLTFPTNTSTLLLATPITSAVVSNAPDNALTNNNSTTPATQRLRLAITNGRGTAKVRTIAFTLNSSADEPTAFAVGQVINFGTTSGNQRRGGVGFVQSEGGTLRAWNANSGTATVRSIGANSISFEVQNVGFVSTLNVDGAFTLNGTVAASGLKVVNENN